MRRRVLAALGTLAVVAATVAMVRAVGINHDVAWFVEVARQIREGATLYGPGLHDPKELNPPLAIWLFVPTLWLAATLGLTQVAAPALLVAIEAALALGVTWRLLREFPTTTRVACLLATAVATTTLAGYDFAQREHQLVLLLTPALWSMALCVAERPPTRGARIAAGALAGVGVAFKPHFVIAWGLVEIATAVHARRPRLVWRAETFFAGAVLLAYAVTVLVAAPGYLPLLREVAGAYSGWLDQPWRTLVAQPEALLALGALALGTVYRGTAPLARAALSFALAAGAFALVAVLQRKGFSYHWYPAFAWGTLAALVAALEVTDGSARRLVPHAMLVALALAVAGLRLRVGVARAALHRETARQIARAAGGRVRDAHDVFVLSVPVEGPFPAATYLGLRWPRGMGPGLMGIAMPRPTSAWAQPVRDAVWEDLSAAAPRVVLVSPMYAPSRHPVPSATRTVADFFTVEPRFAAFFAHYHAAGRIDRLGQPYYVVLRRDAGDGLAARAEHP